MTLPLSITTARRRWRPITLIGLAVLLMTPLAVTAQNAPAADECAGGPPGPPGFLLQKAGISASLMAATQDQTTLQGQLITVEHWNVGSDAMPACGRGYQRTLQDVSVSYDGKRSAAGVMSITRNYGAMIQHMFFLTSNASYAYVLGDLYHNNSLGMELRQAYGAGAGYARQAFEVNADLRFLHEQFLSVEEPARLVGIGLGARYSIDLARLVPGGELALAVHAVPVLNEKDAWLADGTAQLLLPFNDGRWGLTISAQNNYLRNAPPAFKRNYFKTTVGLTYTRK